MVTGTDWGGTSFSDCGSQSRNTRIQQRFVVENQLSQAAAGNVKGKLKREKR